MKLSNLKSPIEQFFIDIALQSIQTKKNLFENFCLLDSYGESGYSGIPNLQNSSMSELKSFFGDYVKNAESIKEVFASNDVVLYQDLFMFMDDSDKDLLIKFLQQLSDNLYRQKQLMQSEILRTIEQSPESRYEEEYDFIGGITAYQYLSPLMSTNLFEVATGMKVLELEDKKILDIGAGSGAFVSRLSKQGVEKNNIYALEPSSNAIEYIKSLGFTNSYIGLSTEKLDKKFDIIFLSYFVDRDADQKATFQNAVDLLELSGGKIVFEGLLPCHSYDTQGMLYANEETMVTEGKSIQGDITNILSYFCNILSLKGLELKSTIISSAYRVVSSAKDGKEILPSVIISLEVVGKAMPYNPFSSLLIS